MKDRIIVIGGGAAGLLAAGQAALCGVETILLEKMRHPGRKLRITGKGRCNLTNEATISDFISHFGSNGKFLRQTFERFFSQDLIAFFEDLGIQTVTERGGRVFPKNCRAPDITDKLQEWVVRSGVSIKNRNPVKRIIIRDGQIQSIVIDSQENRTGDNNSRIDLESEDRVILSTGGSSYPATGSTGDGYRMASALGHTIVPVRPALVPIETQKDTARRLKGLALRNINIRMICDEKKKAEAFGEAEFTDFGMTGPIILSLSRQIVDALNSGQKVSLSLDLKPALSEQLLDARLCRDIDSQGGQPFKKLLRGLIPVKLIPICIEQTHIHHDKTANQITSKERLKLRSWLKDFRLDVSKSRSFSEAIITAGGVSLKEVDPRTMASRLVENLYFAGEVLDIDADTGGYNLQAAFSTGWLAGRSAAGE